MQRITKIVLTGGPCAGKSKALSRIQKVFTDRGYRVLIIAETATELMSGGVAPWTCGSVVDYQTGQMHLQQAKEAVYLSAARTMADEEILIVCDRGMMDNRAYMSDEEFRAALQCIGRTEKDLLADYDGIFHLVSTAKDAPEVYLKKKDNNPTRIETLEQAVALDERTVSVWREHPYLRMIDNSTDFPGKLKRLIAEIEEFLNSRK